MHLRDIFPESGQRRSGSYIGISDLVVDGNG